MITLICEVCKKEFYRRQRSNKYCSRQCYYKMKKIRGDRPIWTEEMRKSMSEKYKGSGNPMYGKASKYRGLKKPEFSGENHPNWKGGYWINKDGYKTFESIYTNGEKVSEHRKIVEEHIGRKLGSDEIVHHINKNTSDNRIENLMICTRAEHINIHRDKLEKARKII